MKFPRFKSSLAPLALVSLAASPLHVSAQTRGTIYSWTAAGLQDWFKNFGSGTATLSNPGGILQILETSATAGASAAYSDGFNTARESYGIGNAGGLDLTG